MDPELLKEAERYRDFHNYARAQFRKVRGLPLPKHNEFIYYSQDEKKQTVTWIIRLPLPNEEPKPTIDALTLTRGEAIDENDPNYLFRLIQGGYTRLPKQFVELQPEVHLWIFCFEKTGRILAELVHESLHDYRAKGTLAKLQLDYELRRGRSKQRMKFQIEPHVELLALGLNRGLGQTGVTAEDRAAYLDDYCPDCPFPDDPDESRHPVTSVHRLWRQIVELKRRFSVPTSSVHRKKIGGLSITAWQGFQQLHNAMFRAPRTLLEVVMFELEHSESLSAGQRALRDELRLMGQTEKESLNRFLSERSRLYNTQPSTAT